MSQKNINKPGIYPPVLPDEIIDDSRREAERIVYKKLKDQLDGFTIFYNCIWLDSESGKIPSDGEADFIIAHPHWGLIVFEVKGGIISRDDKTRIWRSTNKLGKVYKIKNPIEQALKSKHIILRKIRKTWRGKPPFIRAKHGVIFPDSGRPKGINSLGADMPLDIFAFAEDINELGARVIQILMHEPKGSETRYENFGDRGIKILHDLFDRGFKLDISLLSSLEADDKKISELTEQQKQFLELTVYQKRILVTGGAGTGKTTLAIEKARRLAKEANNVLLLCYNKPLAVFLQSQVSDCDNITASSFHQFCASAALAASINLPEVTEVDDGNDFFESILPNALLDALTVNEELRFDAIIVDEGQDFLSQWWEPLLLSMHDEKEGCLYIFKDNNQQIYHGQYEDISGIPNTPLHLPNNLRNTKSIFNATKKFYSGGALEGVGPKGKDIEWVTCVPGKEIKIIEGAINKLVNIEGISQRDITVLSATAIDKSIFKECNHIGQYKTKKAENISDDLITLDTIFRFKGLESKVVVLTNIDAALYSKELLYVGLSRARVLLLIVASENTSEKLKQIIGVSG